LSIDRENELFVALILILFGSAGYLLGLPYLMELAGSPGFFLGGLMLSTLINVAILAVMVFLGLRLGQLVGLGAPILNADLNGESVRDKLKELFKFAPILGLISGVLVFILDVFFFAPLLTPTTPPIVPSQGSRVLAILYGGIYEELFLRLFILTAVIWFIWKLKQREDGTPYPVTFWIGIILSTLVFGLMHLSTTALVIEITPIVVARAIILNGIPGFIFGWLYWKQGIESAIVAHVFADFVMHVVLQQLLLALV
jgi:membrane protease YdiL (CAAX protease family)